MEVLSVDQVRELSNKLAMIHENLLVKVELFSLHLKVIIGMGTILFQKHMKMEYLAL